MQKYFQIIFLLFGCFIFSNALGQIVEPIHWSFSTNKISNYEFDLIIKAKLDDNWHLYGQKPYGDDGPVPTSFHFTPNSNYELVGKTSEETLIKKFDSLFGVELNYFEHEATFKQIVKIKSDTSFEIKGDFEFMVCNEVSCQPPSIVPFSFKIEVPPGIINREIFISFLVALFGVLSIYLIGGLKISHNNVKYLSVPRLFLAILTFSFTVYLIPGLWGAPLKLVGGFPPPYFYSESPNGFGMSKK